MLKHWHLFFRPRRGWSIQFRVGFLRTRREMQILAGYECGLPSRLDPGHSDR